MLHPILLKSINLLAAISMLAQPILAAIPPEAVRAAPAEVEPEIVDPVMPHVAPKYSEPLTATMPLPTNPSTRVASMREAAPAVELSWPYVDHFQSDTRALYDLSSAPPESCVLPEEGWPASKLVYPEQRPITWMYQWTLYGTLSEPVDNADDKVGLHIHFTRPIHLNDFSISGIDRQRWFGIGGFGWGWAVCKADGSRIDGDYVSDTWTWPGGATVSVGNYDEVSDIYAEFHANAYSHQAALDYFSLDLPPEDRDAFVLPQNVVQDRSTNGDPKADCPVEVCFGQTQGATADPINTRTGNSTDHAVDLSLPTQAGNLVLTRSYSTFNARDVAEEDLVGGVFSPGWNHNYEVRLIPRGTPGGRTGMMLLQTPGGSRVGFVQSNEQWVPEPGVKGTLLPNAQGGYTYTNTQDTKYIFDSSGRLTELENSRGQQLHLRYPGGKLAFVATGVTGTGENVQPTGSYLEFSYDPTSGKLIEITDSAGRSVTYSYDATGNLKSVTDARGSIWHYSYAGANLAGFGPSIEGIEYVQHYLHIRRQATRDAGALPGSLPILVEYRYDPASVYLSDNGHEYIRAVEERDHEGHVIVSLDYNGASGTNVTYGEGSGSQTITHTYDSRSTLTAQSNTAGGVDTTYDINFRPDRVTDANNNPADLQWSTDGSNLMGLIDALSNPTGFAYDDSHHLNLVENADGTQTLFIYNTATYVDPVSGTTVDNPLYDGDLDGDLLLRKIDNYVDGNPGPVEQDQITNYLYFTTGASKNLLESVESGGIKTCYSYNEASQPIEVYQNCIDRTPGPYAAGEDVLTRTFYNAAGQIVAVVANYTTDDLPGGESPANIDFDEDSTPDAILEVSRDYPEYNQITLTRYNAAGDAYETVIHYNGNDLSLAASYYKDEIYNFSSRTYRDASGRVVATIANYKPGELTGGEEESFDFDADGLNDVTLQISIQSPQYNQVSITHYNTVGRVDETTANAWPGEDKSYYLDRYNIKTHTYYDSTGRVIATVNHYRPTGVPGGVAHDFDFNHDSTPDVTLPLSSEAPEYNQVSLTVYDSAGRVSKTISNYDGSDPGDPATYYKDEIYNFVSAVEYDAAGNVLKSITNFDPNVTGGHEFHLDLAPDPAGEKETLLRVNPLVPDRNQITCAQYDELSRPVLTWAACIPDDGGVIDDYLVEGANLYNLPTRAYYDRMGRQVISVRNYEDPDQDNELDLSTTRNFITRMYYDGLGRIAYVVENYSNDVRLVPGDPAQSEGQIIAGVETMADNTHQAVGGFNPMSQSWMASEGSSGQGVSLFVGWWNGQSLDMASLPTYNPAHSDRNLVTRYLYDDQGRQIVTIRNLDNPDGGALTPTEIQAGYPDRNLVSLTYYNDAGRVEYTVENFVGDLATATAPGYNTANLPGLFNPAQPDQNLLTQYEYDQAGRRYQTTLTRGSQTRTNHTDFDELGRTKAAVANYVDGAPPAPDFNVTTSYIYEALGRITEVTDPAGHVRRSISEQLDAVNNERTSVSIIDPESTSDDDPPGEQDLVLTSTTIINAAGQMVSSKDASNRVAMNRYDAQGRTVETITDPGGLAIPTSISYNLLGQTKTVTRQVEKTETSTETVTTYYHYNNLGQLVLTFENYTGGAPSCAQTPNTTVDTNVCTTYIYDQAGNLLSTTLGNGSKTEHQYDARGQMTREIVDPGDSAHKNITTAYEYNAAGNQTYLIRAPGAGADEQVTHMLYDRLGRPIATDYAGLDLDVVLSYDIWGNRLEMDDTQANGRWAYRYDDMNHLKAVCSQLPDNVSAETWLDTNCTGSVVAYTYFADGSRETLTYPGSTDIAYVYDDASRLDKVENPFGTGVADYGYDGADLAGAALPNGTSSTNTYDTAGRLAQILNEVGEDNLSSFVYGLDDLGNRTTTAETLATPAGGLMGAPEGTVTPTPGVTPTLTVTPTETQAQTATPTITPTETQTQTATPTVTPTVTVSPTPAVSPTETLTLTPGLTPAATETQAPTETPTLTPSETPTAALTPTETPALTETPTAALTPTETPLTLLAAEGEHHWYYDYDGLSRVIYACSEWNDTTKDCEGDEWTYTYDRAGNLLRFDKWDSTTSTVDTTIRYIVNGANQIACLDADQNGECGITETWQYDPYGNLKNDGTNTYDYDEANRLSAVGTTTYTYNGDGDRISQTVGTVTTTYVLDTATPLTMVLSETNASTSVTTRYWHGLDTLAQSDGTTTEYFAYDGLGSVRQLVDATGSVGLAQTFDPYGNGYAKEGSAASSFGYSGEQTDSNGFVFLRARYYNPASGRFFQRDTFRGDPNYPLTLNPYMYGLGNPVLYTDPSGHFVGLLLGALIIGAVTATAYDVMVTQGKGGWDNVASGRIFDPNHYCNLDWGQAALYGGAGAVIGLTVAGVYLGSGYVISQLPGVAGRTLGQAAAWETLGGEALFEFSVATMHGFNTIGKIISTYLLYDAIVDDNLTYLWALTGNQAAIEQLAIMAMLGPLDGPNLAFAMFASGLRSIKRGIAFEVDDLSGAGKLLDRLEWWLHASDRIVKIVDKSELPGAPPKAGNDSAVIVFDQKGRIAQIGLYNDKGMIEYHIDPPHGGLSTRWHWHKMQEAGFAESGHTGSTDADHPSVGDGTYGGMVDYLETFLGFGEAKGWNVSPPN